MGAQGRVYGAVCREDGSARQAAESNACRTEARKGYDGVAAAYTAFVTVIFRKGTTMRLTFCLLLIFCPALQLPTAAADIWKRHTIDQSSRGADGVRLADANGDGRMDIATGWEQGGVVRVYLNPGPAASHDKWPAVTVGEVQSPEDAVFVDLDGDGGLDVVSSCEGSTKTMYVHWAPSDPRKYLVQNAWKTEPIPCTQGQQMWMFALPMQVDGERGVDLIAGSKGTGATVGWLQSPQSSRDLSQWKFHPLYQAGWTMSLVPFDVDGDGDFDVIVSDLKGTNHSVLWLENPGTKAALAGERWQEHRIGAAGFDVMFLTMVDFDDDKLTDVVTTTLKGEIVFFRRTSSSPVAWEPHSIKNPFGVRKGKAVRFADINLDGKLDLVHTTNLLEDERRRLSVVLLDRLPGPLRPANTPPGPCRPVYTAP